MNDSCQWKPILVAMAPCVSLTKMSLVLNLNKFLSYFFILSGILSDLNRRNCFKYSGVNCQVKSVFGQANQSHSRLAVGNVYWLLIARYHLYCRKSGASPCLSVFLNKLNFIIQIEKQIAFT